MTGLAPETSCEESTCTLTPMIVLICALCTSLVEETVTHLFVDCPFARMCWDFIHIDIPLNSTFLELASLLKDQLNSQFFMETIILLCWAIWSARNELIFRGIRLNLEGIKRVFFKELKLLQYRVKAGQEDHLFSWIQNLE
jgi:hypothetical protein